MTPDFTIWDQLLVRYVDEYGRVDYRTWQAESFSDLDTWIHSMAQIPLPTDPDTQIAYWINLYNALTIRQVLKRYPVGSIRSSLFGLPNWISFLYFFERKLFVRDQQKYSLNRIEHGILRGQFQEHRVHFALVCASIGCPLLRNQAYQSDQLQTQLNEDRDQFINNSDKVRFDPESGILYCSKIFKWYRQDFLKVARSIQEFILKYLDLPLPNLTPQTPIRYLPYDWSLNQRTCS